MSIALNQPWSEEAFLDWAVTAGDVLVLPEAGIDVPVAEFYEDVVLEEVPEAFQL